MFETLFNYPASWFAAGSVELSVAWSTFAWLAAALALGVWWGLRYNRIAVGRWRTTLGAVR